MKKLISLVFISIFTVTTLNAQGLMSLGGGGGVPVGDAADLTTFAIAIDLGYLFEISDSFEAGVSTGYHHYFGDEITSGSFAIEVDDIQFLPIAATARVNISDQFYLQGDIGYALELGDGGEGGFYYRPALGYRVSEQGAVDISYSGISVDGGNFSSVLLRFQWQLAL